MDRIPCTIYNDPTFFSLATQLSLIYANVSPDDILLKGELDRLSSSYPNFKVAFLRMSYNRTDEYCVPSPWILMANYGFIKFQVFYTVDKPSKSWRGGTGYVSKDMALKGLPSPGEDTLVLVSCLHATQRFGCAWVVLFVQSKQSFWYIYRILFGPNSNFIYTCRLTFASSSMVDHHLSNLIMSRSIVGNFLGSHTRYVEEYAWSSRIRLAGEKMPWTKVASHSLSVTSCISYWDQ